MKTNQQSDSSATPRLPQVQRERFDGIAHFILALATVAACWQFQAAIANFVPRAGTFAARLERTPEMLANPSYALRYVDTNLATQAAAKARPASSPTAGQTVPGTPGGQSSI